MLTIVNLLDRVTNWVQENICNPVTFKAPPESGEKEGGGYEYQRITPAAFVWTIPTKEKLPPGIISPLPSACVRIQDGEDMRDKGRINLDICFSVWNPGTHGGDIIYPRQQKEAEKDSYNRWIGEKAAEYFKRNTEGWREVWNWIDLALRQLESTESIDGIKINRDSIKFGPFKEEGEITDFYPFWFAYINFTVERQIVRNIKAYEGLL